MIKQKTYAVYYRSIPASLEKLVAKDGSMTAQKDGVHMGMGHACPRLVITVKPIRPDVDKERLRGLETLLDELTSNNQIVGWK